MVRVLGSLLLLATFTSLVTTQLPAGCIDPPWNNGVAEIIVNALEAARPFLITGFPDKGIPPLDPLGPLPNIHFSVMTDKSRLEGNVNETLVMNLAQFITCSVNISIGISQKFDIDLRMHNFHIEGRYDLDGIVFQIFPVFGSGDYRLDVFETGISGGAQVNYNPIKDLASIKDLHLDIFFDRLELMLECILGCGDMADLVNSVISDIAPAILNAVWEVINPILTNAIETGINEALKNVSISEIIKPTTTEMPPLL